jgi:hypothetical protein
VPQLARQALFHLSHALSPFLLQVGSNLFRLFVFASGQLQQASDSNSPINALRVAGTDCTTMPSWFVEMGGCL